MSERSRQVFLSALLVILFFVDLVKHVSNFAIGPGPVCWDAVQYLSFGESVASGDFLLFEHDVNYRTPGYGWFLGMFVACFGKYALVAIVFAQHLLAMLTNFIPAIVCYRITRRVAAACVAYAICVLCVSRLWFANVLLATSLFTFCLALLVWAWYEYLDNPNRWRALLLGLTLSASILVRPVPELLVVPILFTVAWNALGVHQLSRKQAGGHALIIMSVVLLTLSPWVARNWQMFGAPFVAKLPAANKWQVCFQDGASANLPIPDNEGGRRLKSLLVKCGHNMSDMYCYSVTESLTKHGLSDSEIDQLLTPVCVAAIRENPVQFGQAFLKRSVNLWRCVRNEYPPFGKGMHSEHGEMLTWRFEPIASLYETVLRISASQWIRANELVLMGVSIGCLLIMWSPRHRSFGIALALMFAYFTFVTAAVEIENYRYRMVLEPAMVIAVVTGFFLTFRFENASGAIAPARS